MNGEQLCYMYGFVHRSLFIVQSVTIDRLTLLVAITHQFSLIILSFCLQTDFFLCSFTFGFGRKIEL